MKLTTAKIKALDPCKDRLDNYLKHHESFSGTMTAFLDLQNLTHKDKLWVYFRMIPKEYVSLVAADFAERVLHIYEAKYPGDLRPRKAIEAARTGRDAAAFAASDAAHAAAFAAHAVAFAAHAAHAAAFAAGSQDTEEAAQIQIMNRWMLKSVRAKGMQMRKAGGE